MNIKSLKAAGVDYEIGVKRFLGKNAVYERILSRFLKDTTFSRIRADHESGDDEKLLLDAHEYKGMCGNIALTKPYETAEALVSLLRRDVRTREEIDSAYAALENSYITAYEAIKSALEVSK